MSRSVTRLVILLALGALAVAYANHVPSVVPASAPATEFSAERAMAHVRVIAARPHPIGSAEQRVVAEYIIAQLKGIGVEAEVQEATAVGTRYPVAGRVRNIVARIPGSEAGKSSAAVLLMAHYDAVPAAPGAGDDASGSSVLLETARALRASPALRHDVILLFTDGEETGLLGAAAFVREHRWARDVAVTLNFEARGTHGPSMMFETGPGNLDIVRALRRVGGGRATSLSTFVYRQLPNDTDLSETARLGQPAMNFAFLDGVNRYHTAQDDVEHLDPRSIQDHGESALGAARELAGNPLPRAKSADAVFFNLPLLGIIVYPERWAGPLSLLLLLPAFFLFRRLRRDHDRWIAGPMLGVAGAIISLGVAVVVAVLVANGIAALHASIGSGSPAQSGLYLTAVAALTLAVASAVHAMARRWVAAPLLHAGGAMFVALLAIVTSFVAPAVSFLFAWPALFALCALTVSDASGVVAKVAGWMSAAVVVFMLLPIAYLMAGVALGLDATGAAAVAVFAVIGAWLLPELLELEEGRPSRGALVLGAAAIVLFAAGAILVRTSNDTPTGSMFAYGVDADSNTAYVGARAVTRGATDELRRRMSVDPRIRPPGWFARLSPVANAAPPPGPAIGLTRATVLSDSSSGDTSWVRVRIVAAPVTSALSLRADSGAVLSTAIDGRPVVTSGYRVPPRGRFSIDYVAPAADGFEIVFATRRTTPFVLTALSYRPGIPKLQWTGLPERPAGVIPIQRGDFTVVHQRLRIR